MVDPTFSAIGKHTLKLLALLCGCTGDTLIGIDICHRPVLTTGDEVGIVSGLRHEGIQLVAGIRADTGIGSHTEFLEFRLLDRVNHDNFFLLKCEAAFRFMSTHAVHLLISNKQYHNVFSIAIWNKH